MAKKPPTTTVVKGWCVQIHYPNGFVNISREHFALVKIPGGGTVFDSRRAARMHRRELLENSSIEPYRVRVRRATVTLSIAEDE